MKRSALQTNLIKIQPVIIGAVVALVWLGIFWLADSSRADTTKRLTVYGGTVRIVDANDALEIGDLGGGSYLDVLSSGEIYLRPNLSTAGSYFSGVPGTASQRLYLSAGLDGQPTLEATGIGQAGAPNQGSAIRATFDGAGLASGGSAVYGEASNCGAARTCYAGYFKNDSSGGDGSAVIVANNSASNPTLLSINPSGPAAELVGHVQVSKDFKADANQLAACAWVPVAGNGGQCPAGQFTSGARFSPANVVSEYRCCSL